ncbi:MAG: DUF547 domain-containing protein [Pikeienuella sp.]
MKTLTRRFMLVGLGATWAGGANALGLTPSPDLLGQEWTVTGTAHDPDYTVWAGFLNAYIKATPGSVTLVDYAGALADGADAALSAWLAETQQIDPATLRKPAQMAWWINLYNAVTVDLVLKHYPVKTIRKINGGWFDLGPWGDEVVTVNGQRLSLNDIEHRILRPIWRDPRIHYAVNCASIGCPDLAAEPWRAEGLEGRLDDAARAYVNHPRGVRIEGGNLIVSSIYDWFAADFGNNDAEVIAHLRRYGAAPLRDQLQGRTSIDGDDYDWSLNATPTGQG